MMWSYNATSWIWMMPMMLLIWMVVIGVVILMVRALSAPREKGDAAMEALRRRLAAGQITPEEYERTTKILRS